ncbi:acyl-CoA synthetase family protein [Wolffia australiana]
MEELEELHRLFAELAVSVRSQDGRGGHEEAAEASISSLVERLNPNHRAISPKTRVLDAILSIMCFGAREVYGSTVDCIVRNLISVLSSSVCCNVLRAGGDGKRKLEVLSVGSRTLLADNEKLIRGCIDVLGILKGHDLFRSLVGALLKVAVSSSNFQCLFPLSMCYVYHQTPNVSGSSAILDIQSLLPQETYENITEIPLRLLLWYLDPSLLKDDISNLLRESLDRPFLRLKDELHKQLPWRTLFISLILSPTAFTHTRALLHNWFLMTGLGAVADLQAALTSSLADALSRPMRWGLSMVLSLKLPPLRAYFTHQQAQLLAALTEPVSRDGLLHLVNLIQAQPAQYSIDHNSPWALSMNFPAWFSLAAALIFAGENKHQQAGSWYVSFILSPVDRESSRLVGELIASSANQGTHQKGRKRKAKGVTWTDTWLRNFHVSSPLHRALGMAVLVSRPRLLGEEEFALLLNYVATCRLSEERITWPLRGAALVFNLLDQAEEISGGLFEEEDEGVFCVRLMKTKSAGHLRRCIDDVLLLEEREMVRMDLEARMSDWTDQSDTP